jgi:hypothetical protein
MARTALSKQKTDFAIWKTIKLGVFVTAMAYTSALRRGEFLHADERCQRILRKVRCAQKETELDLVLLKLEDILTVYNFDKPFANIEDICTGGLILGLRLCPAEVGPALRLAYREKPQEYPWLFIAMECIRDPIDHYPRIFCVSGHNEKLWLEERLSPSRSIWTTERPERFVFVKPRK